jgi:two-component system nitrate/nitrite response regulator NarL
MRRIRVMIVGRHPLILQGLSSVLGAQRDFRIAARCGDAASYVEAVRICVPDITLLEISMPDIGGLEILVIASSKNLPTRLVLFTASAEDRDLQSLAAAGAHAVIPQDVDPEILVQILRQVADGQRLLPLSLSDEVVFRAQGAVAEKALLALTDRERQIMRLASEGLSNKEIGRRLNITDGTIKVHLHHIFRKLDVSNRTALATLVHIPK